MQSLSRPMGAMSLFILSCGMHVSAFGSEAPQGAWYKGDLHAHSNYSDGNSPVKDVLRRVEYLKLDFFALTDHDSKMGGFPKHWSDPDLFSSSVVLLHGVEWTTACGHANIFAPESFPYDALWKANQECDSNTAFALAHDYGALFSINHPNNFHDGWKMGFTADSMEVWNSFQDVPVQSNRLVVDKIWDKQLISGKRMTAVGGSDAHMNKGPLAPYLTIATPTTWVFAPERNAQGILTGIKAGHVSISASPTSERLELKADQDSDGKYETLMGEDVAATDHPVHFRIEIFRPDASESTPQKKNRPTLLTHAELATVLAASQQAEETTRESKPKESVWAKLTQNNQYVVLIKDKKIVQAWRLDKDTSTIEFSDMPTQDNQYYRVELWGPAHEKGALYKLMNSGLKAVTNPIYVRK